MVDRIRGRKNIFEAVNPRKWTPNRVKHFCNQIGKECAKSRQMVEARDDLGKPVRELLLQHIMNIQVQASKDRHTFLRGSYSGVALEADGKFIPKLMDRGRAVERIKEGFEVIQDLHHRLQDKNSSEDTFIKILEEYLGIFRAGGVLSLHRDTSSGIPTQQERIKSLSDLLDTLHDRERWEFEHADALRQSRKILELMKELRTCERSQLPEVLANFLDATYLFPEEMSSQMPASEKLARAIKALPSNNFFSLLPVDPRYIEKDLERGGPIARLVNREQKFREARGLILPIDPIQLLEIYNREYQNIHGADKSIGDRREFLQVVGELDIKLQGGMSRGKELSSTAVPIITGVGRAPYIRDLPTTLDKCGFSENRGTLVELGGGPGWNGLWVQKEMTKLEKPFSTVHVFDVCTEEEALSPDVLEDYRLPHRDSFIPTDEDRQELAQSYRYYECDLTKDKLTEWINPRELREPLVYDLANILGYYDKKGKISIFKRLRDIPEALGREPASLLYVSYGLAHNRDLMGGLLIDLTTGHLLRADREVFGLKGSNVRGSKDPPFQIEEDELVRIIEAKRKVVEDRREQFPVMNDKDFERLCEEYKLETGKWEFSQDALTD